VKVFLDSRMEGKFEMDDKTRPTEQELLVLRAKVVEALGDITNYQAWVSADRAAQAEAAVLNEVAEIVKLPKEKVWNTWDHWEEMRAH
jgi:hypothetical protein